MPILAFSPVEAVNRLDPNLHDGVEGMPFIARSAESSAKDGAWLPFRHPKSRE